MVGYQDGAGPLHRTHPLTSIALLGFVAAGVFSAPGLWNAVFLGLVAVLILAERVRGVFKTTVTLAVPFWILLLLIHGILGDSWERGVVLAIRITAMLGMFMLFLASVHPGRLVEALIQKRVPFSVAFLFAAALQAVPDLKSRASAVLEAQRCRGVRMGGGLSARVRVMVPLIVPLVIGSLITLDEKTIALETRGAVAGARKTLLHPPEDGPVGKVVRWGAVAGSVALLSMAIVLW